MPVLASTDWLIFLIFLFCSVAIGLSMRSNPRSAGDFLHAGRGQLTSLPTWICSLAFLAATLGSDTVLAAGAAGARYGLRTGFLFSIGSVVALFWVGQFMMPIYYASGARTLPEFLGQRFDNKTRVLSACTFVVMALLSAGISLALIARLLTALRIFDPIFIAYGFPRQAIPGFCIVLFAVVVFLYVVFAGLAGAMINQALQFALLVAGFLPMVWKGLDTMGGFSGFNAAIANASAQGFVHANRTGISLLALALGLIFGAMRFVTDFRVIQSAMAAKNAAAARRISILAAAAWLLLPLLLVLPGAIAIASPTPQSQTVIRSENGTIYHEITIVPPAIAQGHGVVPARIDPATQKPQLGASGHPRLDYAMATPNMIVRTLPTGLLGLGLAALLAGLLTTLATSITAVSAVFTWDIYGGPIRKSSDDQPSLRVPRFAMVGATLVILGVAFACTAVSGSVAGGLGFGLLAAGLLVFTLFQAPQLGTYLLGAFTKRAKARGAFAGLIAGLALALLHYGLTLPQGCHPGLMGGWIAAAYRYPSFAAEWGGTAAIGLLASALVACFPQRPSQHIDK